MRASRLLRMLLILQNRGRQTTKQLSAELEVSTRTIMRDVDALQEAGLPMLVYQGNRGGIELGFNYRTRLTGLTQSEARAFGVILASPIPLVTTLGLEQDAQRALAKIRESLPTSVREIVNESQQQFMIDNEAAATDADYNELIEAFSKAIDGANIMTVYPPSGEVRTIHPISLIQDKQGWLVQDALKPDSPVRLAGLIKINISAKSFVPDTDERISTT